MCINMLQSSFCWGFGLATQDTVSCLHTWMTSTACYCIPSQWLEQPKEPHIHPSSYIRHICLYAISQKQFNDGRSKPGRKPAWQLCAAFKCAAHNAGTKPVFLTPETYWDNAIDSWQVKHDHMYWLIYWNAFENKITPIVNTTQQYFSD